MMRFNRTVGFALVLSALSMVSWGDNVAQIWSTNTVGITRINSPLVELPIGVVYGDYAPTNVPHTVTNLVSAKNLDFWDELWVYDYSTEKYGAFAPDGLGGWESVPDAKGDYFDPTNRVRWGRGVWLIRDMKGRADTNVYLMGQVPCGVITTVARKGSADEPTSTLMSFPHSEDLDLNDTNVVNWVSCGTEVGDEIHDVDETTAMPRRYQYEVVSGVGKWYHRRTIIVGGKIKNVKVYDLTIPRGKAFWFVRAKGHLTDLTITWNLDKVN